MSTAATIIGFSLAFVSELLPFIPVSTNGILQTFINGFSQSCSNPDEDITLAQQLLSSSDGGLASLVTTAATNKTILTCFENILSNQHLIPAINNLISSQQMTSVSIAIPLPAVVPPATPALPTSLS